MIAELVYLLCALTSGLCAVLLLRGYRRSRTRLLFWSSLCFMGLTANNVVLFVDLVLVPTMDLAWIRVTLSVVSFGSLLFGLIWERDQ